MPGAPLKDQVGTNTQLTLLNSRLSSINCGPLAGQDRGRRFYKSLLGLDHT